MNDSPHRNWKPSPREQHFLWWLVLLMKYPIGGGGFLYEAFIAHDHVAMIVFGALATSLNVGQVLLGLFKTAQNDARAVEKVMREVEAESLSATTDEPSDEPG